MSSQLHHRSTTNQPPPPSHHDRPQLPAPPPFLSTRSFFILYTCLFLSLVAALFYSQSLSLQTCNDTVTTTRQALSLLSTSAATLIERSAARRSASLSAALFAAQRRKEEAVGAAFSLLAEGEERVREKSAFLEGETVALAQAQEELAVAQAALADRQVAVVGAEASAAARVRAADKRARRLAKELLMVRPDATLGGDGRDGVDVSGESSAGGQERGGDAVLADDDDSDVLTVDHWALHELKVFVLVSDEGAENEVGSADETDRSELSDEPDSGEEEQANEEEEYVGRKRGRRRDAARSVDSGSADPESTQSSVLYEGGAAGALDSTDDDAAAPTRSTPGGRIRAILRTWGRRLPPTSLTFVLSTSLRDRDALNVTGIPYPSRLAPSHASATLTALQAAIEVLAPPRHGDEASPAKNNSVATRLPPWTLLVHDESYLFLHPVSLSLGQIPHERPSLLGRLAFSLTYNLHYAPIVPFSALSLGALRSLNMSLSLSGCWRASTPPAVALARCLAEGEREREGGGDAGDAVLARSPPDLLLHPHGLASLATSLAASLAVPDSLGAIGRLSPGEMGLVERLSFGADDP
eukprot:CAMPEP_0170736398 /NCGR_PEP_ID=MMETSP0437-20130122/3594_1 /TAXON_ID=0 /ORGANISM="Sexangularia sp." /LENGTH=583 /DNA_ID=CAMNT_0011074759 /DNA_START=49 /DNA_END=1797 /DNA_ORIENTATION=-